MYTTSTYYSAAVTLFWLSQSSSASFFHARQESLASSTALPTVPSFTQQSFQYGAYSSVYPSGYTLPSGEASATPTITAVDSATSGGGYYGNGRSAAQASQARYLQSMCAPDTQATATAYPGFDTRYPCNEVLNITYTCIYNVTAEEQPSEGTNGSLIQSNPQAQQECLCPGGAGAAIWENVEACDDCLRLHGASALNRTGAGAQFVPTAFVKDLSSAYCAMPTATVNWDAFASNFSRTHPATYGTETGGVDLLKNKTAVSNYFTSTPLSAQSSSTPGTSAPARVGSNGSRTTARAGGSGTGTAPARSTGGAGSLQVSGLLGIGLLGAAWLL